MSEVLRILMSTRSSSDTRVAHIETTRSRRGQTNSDLYTPILIGIFASIVGPDLLLLPVVLAQAENFSSVVQRLAVIAFYSTAITSPLITLLLFRIVEQRRALAYVIRHQDRLPLWHSHCGERPRIRSRHARAWVRYDRKLSKRGLPPGKVPHHFPPTREFAWAYGERWWSRDL